jgi:hypothetical protein
MMSVWFYQFLLDSLLTSSKGLGNLFHFNIEVLLSSSMVIGPLLLPYLDAHLFYTITDTASKNFIKSTDLLSMLIGLPCHGCQNFKKLG